MSTIARGEGGRWLPGVSGNPSGRPRVIREVQALARTHTPEAIAQLARNMAHENGSASNYACAKMIEIGWGKAPLVVKGDDEGADRVLGYDLSKLSLEQLRTLRDLIALARTPEADESEVIDVTPKARERGGDD